MDAEVPICILVTEMERQRIGMGKKQLSSGDRFVKQDLVVPVVWVVDRMIDSPGLPTHVRLVREDRPIEMCTISVHALSNRRYFRPAGLHA